MRPSRVFHYLGSIYLSICACFVESISSGRGIAWGWVLLSRYGSIVLSWKRRWSDMRDERFFLKLVVWKITLDSLSKVSCYSFLDGLILRIVGDAVYFMHKSRKSSFFQKKNTHNCIHVIYLLILLFTIFVYTYTVYLNLASFICRKHTKWS